MINNQKNNLSNDEHITAYALRSNELLTSYISLHDSTVRVTGLISLLKSIFKSTDFEQLHNDSAILLNQSNSLNNELNAYRSTSFGNLSEDQKIYINQLLAFTGKLDITLQFLKERQLLLYRKSQGERRRRKEYSSIERKYKYSIEEYMEEGKRLMTLSM